MCGQTLSLSWSENGQPPTWCKFGSPREAEKQSNMTQENAKDGALVLPPEMIRSWFEDFLRMAANGHWVVAKTDSVNAEHIITCA
jgi:hypothetical protein